MTSKHYHPHVAPIPAEAIADARKRAREADRQPDSVLRKLEQEGAVLEVAAEWGNIEPDALILAALGRGRSW